MNERQVRVVLVGIVLVAVLGGIVALSRLRDARQDRTELESGARSVAADAPGEAFRGPTCSAMDFVRCTHDRADPETIAERLQAALSVAAGQDASLRCETLPGRTPSQSCTVRVERGRHGVLVTVDSQVRRGDDGRPVPDGSTLRISAY